MKKSKKRNQPKKKSKQVKKDFTITFCLSMARIEGLEPLPGYKEVA
jgi:transcription elongation factor Elf1